VILLSSLLIGTVEAVIGPLFLSKLIFSFAIAPSTVSNAGHLHAATAVITFLTRLRRVAAAFALQLLHLHDSDCVLKTLLPSVNAIVYFSSGSPLGMRWYFCACFVLASDFYSIERIAATLMNCSYSPALPVRSALAPVLQRFRRTIVRFRRPGVAHASPHFDVLYRWQCCGRDIGCSRRRTR
jgi:hypothetical protein